MNEDANTATIRNCYEKFSQGDITGLLEHISEDIDFAVPEVENAPYGGIWHGRSDVERFFELVELAEDLTDFEVREYIAQGDRVVVLGRSTATVRSTGRHYSTEWVHVHTVREGRITSFVEYFDTAAALRAFQKVTMALK
ncbi:MAG TPA: nuclear transport factor 2 family protein [Pyrinomonadaceae bacterium]|nr:nuclear transport factor 2 family protein [Pyrinomonadaceae bacterium]